MRISIEWRGGDSNNHNKLAPSTIMIFEDPPNKEPYSCIINSKTMVKKQNNIKFCSIPFDSIACY